MAISPLAASAFKKLQRTPESVKTAEAANELINQVGDEVVNEQDFAALNVKLQQEGKTPLTLGEFQALAVSLKEQIGDEVKGTTYAWPSASAPSRVWAPPARSPAGTWDAGAPGARPTGADYKYFERFKFMVRFSNDPSLASVLGNWAEDAIDSTNPKNALRKSAIEEALEAARKRPATSESDVDRIATVLSAAIRKVGRE